MHANSNLKLKSKILNLGEKFVWRSNAKANELQAGWRTKSTDYNFHDCHPSWKRVSIAFLGSNLPIESNSFLIHYLFIFCHCCVTFFKPVLANVTARKKGAYVRGANLSLKMNWAHEHRQVELEQEEGKQTDASLYFDLMFAAVHKW